VTAFPREEQSALSLARERTRLAAVLELTAQIRPSGEEIGGLGLVPAGTMRATAAECLLPVASQAIRKHLRDRGVGAQGRTRVHGKAQLRARRHPRLRAEDAVRLEICEYEGATAGLVPALLSPQGDWCRECRVSRWTRELFRRCRSQLSA
jgi:hypothetical protein